MLHIARQFLLPITDPLAYIEAIAESRRAGRVGRRQRKAITGLRTTLLELVKVDQLDLFGTQPITTDQPAPTPSTKTAFYAEVANTWTDAQIVALCDGMIKANLEGLRDFKNDARRRDLLTWFAPSSDRNDLFSMAFCCAVAGLDAQVISEQVWRMYRQEIRGLIEQDERTEPEPTFDRRQTALAYH